MLTLKFFNNQRVRVINAAVNFSQNQISTFNATVQYKDIALTLDSLPHTDIALIYKNTTVVSGIVDDFALRVNSQGEMTVEFRCLNEFGRLGIIKSNSKAYYENEPVLFILDNLLSISSQWELGDVTTMLDRAITTTIDLRAKETLWAQIIGAIEQIPETFVRYGGTNPINGRHRIDVGAFGERAEVALIQGRTIKDLSVEYGSRRLINHIEAYGGDANGTRISLEHALNFDGTLATHPDYPILDDGAGRYYVVNNNLSIGASVTREYTKIKLDGTPTSGQIDEAGYALWQAAVRDFEINSTTREHQGEAFFDESVYGEIITDLLSRNIYVHTTSRQTVIDFTTGITNSDTIVYQLDGLLRIIGYGITFTEVDKTYQLQLSETAYTAISDNAAQLFDVLTPNTPAGGSATPITYVTFSEATVTEGPGDTPDTYYYHEDPDIWDAKRFTFTPPAAGGATRLGYAIFKVDAHLAYKLEQLPTLGGTTLIIAVIDDTIDEWTTSSEGEIGVVWILS